jgi:hypothetical protein
MLSRKDDHPTRVLVVVKQIKQDNYLNEDIRDNLGQKISTGSLFVYHNHLTVLTETPTSSCLLRQCETSLVKASISKLKGCS